MSKKIFLVFSILIVAALLVSACASTQPVPTEEPAAPEPTDVPEPEQLPEEEVEPEPEPEPTEEVTEEEVFEEVRGTLRFTDGLAYGGSENLDPVDEARFWPPISLLYDRLTEPAFDSMTPTPSLASSWESDELGKVWTFYLRDDVYFHDGTQLTAADVVYSVNHWKTSETSILATTFEVVDSVEAQGDFTVVFDLNQPVVTFPLTVMDYRATLLMQH